MQVRERLRTEAPVVIDASVAVQWFAPEPGSDDAALLALGVDVIPSAPLLTRALRFAFDLDHALYDCVYLALAARYGARLTTADGRLRRSAARISVPVWRP